MRDIFSSGGVDPNATFITNLVIKPISFTEIEINIDTYNFSSEPTSYKIYIQKKIYSNSSWINDINYPLVTLDKTSDPFLITNLIKA